MTPRRECDRHLLRTESVIRRKWKPYTTKTRRKFGAPGDYLATQHVVNGSIALLVCKQFVLSFGMRTETRALQKPLATKREALTNGTNMTCASYGNYMQRQNFWMLWRQTWDAFFLANFGVCMRSAAKNGQNKELKINGQCTRHAYMFY